GAGDGEAPHERDEEQEEHEDRGDEHHLGGRRPPVAAPMEAHGSRYLSTGPSERTSMGNRRPGTTSTECPVICTEAVSGSRTATSVSTTTSRGPSASRNSWARASPSAAVASSTRAARAPSWAAAWATLTAWNHNPTCRSRLMTRKSSGVSMTS